MSSPILTFHYHRGDGDYRDAGLWIWDPTSENRFFPQEIFATASDSFGVIFHIDMDALAAGRGRCERIGFIPRIHKSWSFKDGSDRFWSPKMGSELWLVEEDEKVHTRPPEVDPRVRCAFLDEPSRILVNLSHPIARECLNARNITVVAEDGKFVEVTEFRAPVNGERVRLFELILSEPIEPVNRRLTVEIAGYRPGVVMPRNVMMDRARFYSDEPLGVICGSNCTTFRYFSPGATSLTVIVYNDREGDEGRFELPLRPRANGTWEGQVERNLEGHHYSLHVAHNMAPEGKLFVDPYAVNTVGSRKRARITNVRPAEQDGITQPSRINSIEKPTDAVVYEMHVRDFTISPDSGAQHPGTYLGFVEPGTRHPDDPLCKTGLDHLRELGVTHVQLLPVQDFDNDEERPTYDWGYMTAFFNSPEGWYATDITSDARITEFKRLVRGLHEAGIGVIMDVVYNHTGEMNTFEDLAPKYFHRFRDNGTKHNGSGTGNEFRSEAPMARRFIVDSCRYWVEHYGVDGFRFDLMGLIDMETMKQVREELHKINPRILVYGEPWIGGEAGISNITDKWAIRGTGIAAFNDHFRNALKGDPDSAHPGYVQTGQNRDDIIRGICGSIDDWALNPSDSVNYATCHDNLTLWDKLEISSHEPEEERIKMQLLTFGILAVSQGILFLHGGAEICRTKFGDENSYNSGDHINQIRWSRKRRYWPVFEFHKGMIALRRLHPIFRLATAEEVRRRIEFHYDELPCHEAIVFTLDGDDLSGETWKQALVFINPDRNDKMFRIPGTGAVSIFARGEKASPEPFDSAEGHVLVPSRSLLLAARL